MTITYGDEVLPLVVKETVLLTGALFNKLPVKIEAPDDEWPAESRKLWTTCGGLMHLGQRNPLGGLEGQQRNGLRMNMFRMKSEPYDKHATTET